jgi:hypothetical protein
MKTIYLSKGLVLDNIDHAKIIKDSNDVQSFFVTNEEVVLHSSVATSRIDLEVDLLENSFAVCVIVTLPDDVINQQSERYYSLEGTFDYSPNMDFVMQVDTIEFNGELEMKQLSSDLQGKIYHTINEYVGEECEYPEKDTDVYKEDLL